MSNDISLRPGSPGYRRLGLIGNPFLHPDDTPGSDPIGIRLVAHAATMRLVTAIDRAAEQERPRPVMVLKSSSIPTYYHLVALCRTLSDLSNNDGVGVLIVSVPLEAVRLGKIRATLGVLAEQVAGRTVDRTIAAFAKVALSAPDSSLAEAAVLDDAMIADALSSLDQDPIGTVASWFGERVGERAGETVDHLMRIAVARQARLEAEPEENPQEGEIDASDPMADAFLVPVAEEQAALEDGSPEEASTTEDLIADYLIAHAKVHVSPVVARGMRAYKASGSYAMAQELKITKAPKKTLAALMRFACHRFRKVVLVYDRLEAWPFMPADLKPRLLSMLSELRWITESDGLLVLVTSPGIAPEVEEQFAAAEQVAWDMPGVEQVEAPDASVDLQLVREWIASASLDGPVKGLEDDVLRRLADSDGTLSAFSALAAAAIDDAAQRDADSVDEAAIEIALAGAAREEGS